MGVDYNEYRPKDNERRLVKAYITCKSGEVVERVSTYEAFVNMVAEDGYELIEVFKNKHNAWIIQMREPV